MLTNTSALSSVRNKQANQLTHTSVEVNGANKLCMLRHRQILRKQARKRIRNTCYLVGGMYRGRRGRSPVSVHKVCTGGHTQEVGSLLLGQARENDCQAMSL
eukprot:947364-Pelagomonas_calceolata.AAC.2